jgi:uncharacterized protein YgiM (DUF1202 family)
MKTVLQGLTKFFLGILLSLIILLLAGAAVARYFMGQLAALPERPAFENDDPVEAVNDAPVEAAADPAPEPTAAAPEEPAAEPAAPEPAEAQTLPPGAYEVVVVQPMGLVLRSGPDTANSSIGGVDPQAKLVVLEESNGWMKVRSANGREGWVRGAGNTRRVD